MYTVQFVNRLAFEAAFVDQADSFELNVDLVPETDSKSCILGPDLSDLSEADFADLYTGSFLSRPARFTSACKGGSDARNRLRRNTVSGLRLSLSRPRLRQTKAHVLQLKVPQRIGRRLLSLLGS